MSQAKRTISTYREAYVGGSHNRIWTRLFSGYNNVEQAKKAALRSVYSVHFSSTLRVLDRCGIEATCYEAQVTPRRRTAEWRLIDPDDYFACRNNQGGFSVMIARDFPVPPGKVPPGWTHVKAYSVVDAITVAEFLVHG